MGDTPQQGLPGDGAPAEDALSPSGTVARPLVERSEVVWLVAWVSLGMILLGLVSMLGGWSAASPDAVSQPQFLTDINSAPAAELALLPGIGTELAERIVTEREAAGPFVSAEQLARVRGIGPKRIEQLAPLIIYGDCPTQPTSAAIVEPAQRLTEPARPAPAHAQSPSPATVAGE